MRSVLLMLAALSSPVPLVAQATLGGTVRDQVSNRPIPGAEVLVASGPRALTDSTGTFVLHGLTPGTIEILLRRVGYAPVRFEVTLGPRRTDLDVDLVPVATTVDSLSVTADAPRLSPAMTAFNERRLRGAGTFIPAEKLREKEHSPLAEVLRGISSLKIHLIGTSKHLALNPRKNGCPYAIVYNGVILFRSNAAPLTGGSYRGTGGLAPTLEEFNVRDLEAVEVYSGPAEMPPEFNWVGSDCGVIVLHGRER